jgi:putative endonuclease
MGKHNETGIKGEQIAVNFLLKKGYKILHNNWRHERKEIDIIAQKDDLLVFVEVKTRNRTDFGFPEEAVKGKKQGFMKLAAEAYMDSNKEFQKIQFDIISILIDNEGTVKELLHFEDAFY